MNSEEAFNAAQLMVAFADPGSWSGLLEYRIRDGEWKIWDDTIPLWDWYRYEYRHRPTPTLRPYTYAELIELVGQRIIHKDSGGPWDVVYLHVGMDCAFCRLQIATGYRQLTVSSEDLLAGWTHTGGSPCGMEVE